MRKFKFNLEALLKLRNEQETAAKLQLAEAQQVVHLIDEQIEALEQQRISDEDSLADQKSKGFRADDLAASMLYLDKLRTQILSLQDERLRALNTVQQRRQEVAKAMQERKTIDRLKEKKHAEWEAEYRRAEKNFLDEQATMRYLQNRGG